MKWYSEIGCVVFIMAKVKTLPIEPFEWITIHSVAVYSIFDASRLIVSPLHTGKYTKVVSKNLSIVLNFVMIKNSFSMIRQFVMNI